MDQQQNQAKPHNIPTREGRDQVVRELVRVLKPGGRIALYDLNHTSRYRDVLRESGMAVEVVAREFLWLVPSRSPVGRKVK